MPFAGRITIKERVSPHHSGLGWDINYGVGRPNAALGDQTLWQDDMFRWGHAASDWDPKLPHQAGDRSDDEGLWL